MVGTRVFAFGEDTRTLRLTSELVDLRVGYANPILARRARSWARSRGYAAIKNAPLDLRGAFFMAAELGFEPRHTESESAVLPLHNSAKCPALFALVYCSTGKVVCQGVFKKYLLGAARLAERGKYYLTFNIEKRELLCYNGRIKEKAVRV